jgi:hypothetical protein
MAAIASRIGQRQPRPDEMKLSAQALSLRTSGSSSFEVAASRRSVLSAIQRYAEAYHYTVVRMSKSGGQVVLSRDTTTLSPTHCGYWLILQVTPQPGGHTEVAGDVRAKALHASFSLRLYRNRALQEIQRYVEQDAANSKRA